MNQDVLLKFVLLFALPFYFLLISLLIDFVIKICFLFDYFYVKLLELQSTYELCQKIHLSFYYYSNSTLQYPDVYFFPLLYLTPFTVSCIRQSPLVEFTPRSNIQSHYPDAEIAR